LTNLTRSLAAAALAALSADDVFCLLYLEGGCMSNTYKTLWDQYEAAVHQAGSHGHLGKAARIVKDALRESEDYGEIPQGLVDLAHMLADCYLKQLRFFEAESLYRAVLEVREKLLGQNHQDVIDSLKKVAIVQIMAFRSEALGPGGVDVASFWVADSVAVAS
jgi:hypothetical protein